MTQPTQPPARPRSEHRCSLADASLRTALPAFTASLSRPPSLAQSPRKKRQTSKQFSITHPMGQKIHTATVKMQHFYTV